jgi:hypothetical protein
MPLGFFNHYLPMLSNTHSLFYFIASLLTLPSQELKTNEKNNLQEYIDTIKPLLAAIKLSLTLLSIPSLLTLPSQELKTNEKNNLQEYIDTINSCYPPEIVQYYSPNYSETLLSKLDDYERVM